MLDSIFNLLLVIFAFGFVIFWHELGHFLAARWAGVRVEQFAVGMGQALVSWRKGIGFRMARYGKGGFKWGSTADDFEQRVDAEHRKRNPDDDRELSLREKYDIAREIGLGETEYRLSWVPLGGYVKPTGQDDLRPAAEVGADDPKAFGAVSVGKRMVIISAGVIMNVILAFVLYVALFMIGWDAPAAVAGVVQPGSPAQQAGLKPGDEILAINGDPQTDFTKVQMNVALLSDAEPATFTIKRPGVAQPFDLKITPVKTEASFNMPSIGVDGRFSELVGIERTEEATGISQHLDLLPQGAVITQINGQPVEPNDLARLDAAVQAYDGTPIALTIKLSDGTIRNESFIPNLDLDGFAGRTFSVAGMRPRLDVAGVLPDSPAAQAGLQTGDVIEQLAIADSADALRPPARDELLDWINRAGTNGKKIRITVLRGDERLTKDLEATKSLSGGKKGIGIMLGYEASRPVVAEVLPDSPASAGELKPGDRITSIAGRPVSSWFDVLTVLRAQPAGDVPLAVERESGPQQLTLTLDKPATQALADLRYAHDLPLAQRIDRLHTTNPLLAMRWGVQETKYSIVQVYLTLKRLFQGTVPVSNLSGPLGILSAGSSAADRGVDWLIWFTALISANLAVVNFLPIPIVDGGLFLFLIAEKITGKPPSPRVQTVAQVIGLVLLGGLFLFVTYHDILRQWG